MMDEYQPDNMNRSSTNGRLHFSQSESDDWLLNDEPASQATDDRIPVDQLLYALIGSAEEPETKLLFVLSDLSRADTALVREHWPSIPVDRRRRVIQRLIESAENDLDLHLGRLLRIGLRDADAQVRQLAIEGLWEETATDLIGEFVQILRHDENTEVRAAAAQALGNFILAGELDEADSTQAMRAEEILLAALHDPEEDLLVHCRALESIAYSSEAGVRQLIEDAYYDAEEEMRVSSLVAMGRSADIRWRGLVRAELQNPAEDMRAQAATACGELGAVNARNDLIALLDDPDQKVRLAAIFALGRIGGHDATDALEALALEGNSVEAEAADWALEEMAFYTDPDAVPLFDESLEEFDEWEEPLDGWYDMGDRDLGEYDE